MKKKARAASRDRQTVLPLILLGALILGGLATSCGGGQTERPIRHVILITVDTLRQDALSVYGSRTPTPHIDAFARDGMVFRQAYAVAPWTNPSLASLMTGLSPKVHQMGYLESRLSDDVTTLAEYLQDQGYRTAALGVNDLLMPDSNLDQGFQHYEFRLRSTRTLTRDAIQWLQGNRESSFFLWLHYLDPHGPYAPPPGSLPPGDPPERIGLEFGDIQAVRRGEFVPTAAEQAWIRQLYESEVSYVDQSLGDLFRTLKDLGLYEDALIILTSDHGEEFWEHGSVGHGHTLYDELLRVPLILKLPSSAPIEEISVPVALPALMPTILDVCQVAYARDSLSYGSLTPLWKSNAEVLEPQPIISNRFHVPNDTPDLEAVISADLKYIRSTSPEGSSEELYNLAQDPGETTSLVDSAPDMLREARELLEVDGQQARDLRAALRLEPLPAREIPAEVMKSLKALGYVD